ncbi:MAG: NADH-quinone oxidoreductase subunit L, partial [Actinobacteria bacterium]
MIVAAWICLVAPLAAALLITLLGTGVSRRGAAYLATTSVLGSFAAAAVVFAKLWGESPDARSHPSTVWEWLTAGSFHVGLRILVDPLSVFMMLVVSGVGFLIVAYSIGYMDGDDEERRYFAYMALFVFSMLLLVQAGNLVLLLAGWGLVGLCSYLLIGFWHERPAAIAAAKKAFVMNAIGDATMALAFFLLIQHRQTLNFPDAFAVGPGHGWLVNLVALGLLGGAVAKSAQLPLQTWLPDAMEGPTPVSALIHAATMVTAGVYLIVRTHAVFEQAPRVQELAAGLGAGTLLMAGLIALVQTDIKRVIAYSTMSQIGYMFLGAGLGAYANAEFHLMTHAFFKALLFMAAGLVIHALAGEQDIRKMSGIGRLMPMTRLAFLIGSLALVGLPPFAGFFSKDSIIAAAMDRGWYGYVLFAAALAGTFLTGVYAFRLFFIVFPGELSPFVQEHLMRGSHAAGMEGAHGEDDASRPHGHDV